MVLDYVDQLRYIIFVTLWHCDIDFNNYNININSTDFDDYLSMKDFSYEATLSNSGSGTNPVKFEKFVSFLGFDLDVGNVRSPSSKQASEMLTVSGQQ